MLDNSLEKPLKDAESAGQGCRGGEQWGGFTVAASTTCRSTRWRLKKLPDHLHWSYWESYSTWLTGFALFTMSYLWNA